MQHKACPVIFRDVAGSTDLLAFGHPSAGKQFVKGSIEKGETPIAAATRELEEESGLSIDRLRDLGVAKIGANTWHFFGAAIEGASETWSHRTADDRDHVFEFFWHPIVEDLDEEWHTDFHEAFAVIRRALCDR